MHKECRKELRILDSYNLSSINSHLLSLFNFIESEILVEVGFWPSLLLEILNQGEPEDSLWFLLNLTSILVMYYLI